MNYWAVPDGIWEQVEPLLPVGKGIGRPCAEARAVLNGIWDVLWTGCQWKAVQRNWFGVCSSSLHRYFQEWRASGVFKSLMRKMVNWYGKQRAIGWDWQSINSRSCAAPLGGEATGKNPTDRAKLGSKVHRLVDARGAPLAAQVTGANQHDKWSADDLVLAILVERPETVQHLCADKGYDYPDVHQLAVQQHYVSHIKHRRRRGEPSAEDCPLPGEAAFPARRWVIERTFGWLVKRRSIRSRWMKNPANWLAFIQFACAHILFDLTVYG